MAYMIYHTGTRISNSLQIRQFCTSRTEITRKEILALFLIVRSNAHGKENL